MNDYMMVQGWVASHEHLLVTTDIVGPDAAQPRCVVCGALGPVYSLSAYHAESHRRWKAACAKEER